IRKYSDVPICIDTEGAQIRSKVKKKQYYKKNSTLILSKVKGNFTIYPNDIFDKLKTNDIMDIGFNDLKAKVISKKNDNIKLNVISSGLLEKNKGIHLINRKIKINFLTKKDWEAIEIAKSHNIKNYALSFTNSENDIIKFKKILPHCKKIYKIETEYAVKRFEKLIKYGDNFLIDRGDLSKEITTEMIPVVQRKILNISNKRKNKNIYIATNFLETMIDNKSPTRGEANDIYSSLEMGAKGLVLAAETAIGNFTIESVLFLKNMIQVYKRHLKDL
ncbi:pyruvate kinase, partial [Candidatus Pelagibacter sp.]|nr:pyruvate kinase [Candidatus Pelagibacter sp.]